MNNYPIRSIARLSVAFTDAADEPADPTTVTLTITVPGGDEVEITDVIQDDTGQYHYDYEVAAIGVHRYKFQGDGALIAANHEKAFRGTR